MFGGKRWKRWKRERHYSGIDIAGHASVQCAQSPVGKWFLSFFAATQHSSRSSISAGYGGASWYVCDPVVESGSRVVPSTHEERKKKDLWLFVCLFFLSLVISIIIIIIISSSSMSGWGSLSLSFILSLDSFIPLFFYSFVVCRRLPLPALWIFFNFSKTITTLFLDSLEAGAYFTFKKMLSLRAAVQHITGQNGEEEPENVVIYFILFFKKRKIKLKEPNNNIQRRTSRRTDATINLSRHTEVVYVVGHREVLSGAAAQEREIFHREESPPVV
eukprot:gene2323-1459_t